MASPGLICGMQNLQSLLACGIFSCGMQDLYLWHEGYSSLTRDWTWIPCTGSAVLAPGLPGKSPVLFNYGYLVSSMEKAMATHSNTLAWRIPWTEEPGRLQSMGSLRVRHDWATSLSLFTFMHWRRKLQPTPVFFPGESWGQRSLLGCRLWGCTE